MISVCIFIIITILSVAISSFFQNVNLNFYFSKKNLSYTIFWIIFCLACWILSENYFLIESNIIKYSIFLSLAICSLTDIFEKSIYIIIPIFILLCRVVGYFLNLSLCISFYENICTMILIWIILKILNIFSNYSKGMDGIGDGDIMLLVALSSFYSFLTILFILFTSSLIGSIWIISKKIFFLFLKLDYNEKYICFVPFIMIGTYFTFFLINKYNILKYII